MRARKHMVIFETLLNYCFENDIKTCEDADDSLSSIINFYSLKVSELFPKVDDREYFYELHQLCLQHREIECVYLGIHKLADTYNEHFRSAEGLDQTNFFNSLLSYALQPNEKASVMCIGLIYETMLN